MDAPLIIWLAAAIYFELFTSDNPNLSEPNFRRRIYMQKKDFEKINELAKADVKNDSIRIRISINMKNEFLKACERNGNDSASVIRALIQEYIDMTNEERGKTV